MTLNDLRRLAVKQRLHIRFALSGGSECVVNEHGIAEVPGLRSATEIRLEEELERAAAFSASTVGNAKEKPRTLTREEMAAWAGQSAKGASAGHDAEE